MAVLSKGQTFGATEEITNTKLHNLIDNGTVSNIVNADIDSSANIADSKLASISTASKVNGSALTGLANIPAGAGIIPTANVPGSTPTGGIILWTTTTTPTGYLLCYGQAISRTTYSDLYAVVGDTFGAGDGATTFNVPDLRGRFPLGKDDMGGSSANRVTDTDADTIGGADGEETHTLSVDEIPSHRHTYSKGVYAAEADGLGGALKSLTSDNSGYTGGGEAHNNMSPFITLTYIIKT
jgi:Microcystin-dependent protein